MEHSVHEKTFKTYERIPSDGQSSQYMKSARTGSQTITYSAVVGK
jgi:hypothetical protein